MARCAFCLGKMSWQSDFNYDEVYGEGEGIVSYYTCMNPDCGAEAEFSLRTDKEDEQ